MSFKDIIRKTVLENLVNQTMSVKQMVMLLSLSACIGIFIFIIYRFVCKSGFYSKAFNVSLILMSVLTTTIIITIQTSLVVSLGMVGALSIVRFRTAVKNPLDLVFTFWAITMGIVCGAGIPVLAIVMSLIVAIILIIFFVIPEGKKVKLLHISGSYDTSAVIKLLKEYDSKCHVKSEHFSVGRKNILFELNVKDTTKLIDELQKIDGVGDISVVDHQNQQF